MQNNRSSLRNARLSIAPWQFSLSLFLPLSGDTVSHCNKTVNGYGWRCRFRIRMMSLHENIKGMLGNEFVSPYWAGKAEVEGLGHYFYPVHPLVFSINCFNRKGILFQYCTSTKFEVLLTHNCSSISDSEQRTIVTEGVKACEHNF